MTVKHFIDICNQLIEKNNTDDYYKMDISNDLKNILFETFYPIYEDWRQYVDDFYPIYFILALRDVYSDTHYVKSLYTYAKIKPGNEQITTCWEFVEFLVNNKRHTDLTNLLCNMTWATYMSERGTYFNILPSSLRKCRNNI